MFYSLDIIDNILDKMILTDENHVKTINVNYLNPSDKAILLNYSNNDSDIINLYGEYNKLINLRKLFLKERNTDKLMILTEFIHAIEDEFIYKYRFNGYGDFEKLKELYKNVKL